MSKIVLAALLVVSATPAYAAYTTYTGNVGGFVTNSATSAYLAAQGSPTEFISFNSKADGTPAYTGTSIAPTVNGGIFSNRVTFSSTSGANVALGNPNSTSSEIGPDPAFGGTLVITLASAARAVGFGTVEAPVTASFFDANGQLIQTSATTDRFAFLGLVGTGGSAIKSIQLTGTYFAIQDFQFSAAASVPETASWAMMISGFGLVGATMRRRRVAVSFA